MTTLTAAMFMATSAVPAVPAVAHVAAPPVIVEGVLHDAHGRATSGTVALFAWPPQAGLRPGDEFDLIPVAHGVAGDDGTFTLRAAPTASLRHLAAPTTGFLNLTLRAISAGRVERRFLHLPAGAASDTTRAWAEVPGRNAEPLDVRFGQAPQANPQLTGDAGRCGSREHLRLKSRQEKVPTIVGELHTPADTATASFLYGRRSDSAIGVAYRGYGEGWAVAGEFKAETSSEAGEGVDGVGSYYSRLVKSTFAYGHYDARCDTGTPSYRYEVIRVIEWQPTTTVEPAENRGCLSPGNEFVSEYPENGRFFRVANRANTWSRGVEVYGVGLTTRSGYSKFVRADWRFGTERSQHLLCGDDDEIDRSSRIFAGPRPDGCSVKPPRPCSVGDDR